MGVAPQYLLELERPMLEAIIQVYKERAKAQQDARNRIKRKR